MIMIDELILFNFIHLTLEPVPPLMSYYGGFATYVFFLSET